MVFERDGQDADYSGLEAYGAGSLRVDSATVPSP